MRREVASLGLALAALPMGAVASPCAVSLAAPACAAPSPAAWSASSSPAPFPAPPVVVPVRPQGTSASARAAEDPQGDAASRESWVRAAALGRIPEAEVLAAFDAEDWVVRSAAADALGRAEQRPSDTLLAALSRAASDAHEGVREPAIRAALGWGLTLAERGGGDDEISPAVRLVWAHNGGLEAVARRALDDDPQVATAARWRLFAWGPEAVGQQIAVLRAGAPVEPLLEPLALGGVHPDLPEALEGTLDLAVLHGLRARAGTRYPVLELAWRFEVGADGEDVRNEREEVARLAGEPLGRALLARLAGDRERRLHPTVRRFLLECAAAALPASIALEAVPTLEPAEAELLMEATLDRWTRPHPADLLPFLAEGASVELGDRASRALANSLGHEHHEAAVAALLPLVDGPDRGRQMESFNWLAGAPLAPAEAEALVEAWRRIPLQERVHRLRFLPRDSAPLGFREDLLELAAREATCTASVVELLGTWTDDEQVADVLASSLGRVLDDLPLLAGRGASLEAEARAAERLDALAGVSLQVARPLAQRALELVVGSERPTRHQLLKRAVAVLARDEAGRAALLSLLAPGTPRRARYEAALALAGTAPEASDALVTLHEEVDRVLQLRGVRALAREASPSVDAFLEGLQAGDGPFEVRTAALEALAGHGQVGALARALEQEDPELRLVAVEGLADLEGGAAVLRRAVEVRLRQTPFLRMDEFEGSELLDLLRGVARSGALEPELLRLVLARPAAAARSDLAVRFVDGTLPSPASRWRAELEALEVLARRGQLQAALDAIGPWWRLDARLLRALAWIAREDADLAGPLLTAARIGLQGEADPDPTLLTSWWEDGQGAADPAVHRARRAAALQRLGRLQRARLPR